jgi:hypothetical protein
MTDPLWSARLKLARATEHLDALDEEIRAFARSEVDRVVAQHDPKVEEEFRPVWSPVRPPPGFETPGQFDFQLPDRFVVIVGDFLSNLRSALDHAVNGLAGDKAGLYTKFPIYADSGKFKGGSKGDLEGVSGPCRTKIERMQPYNGHRRGRRLLKLSELVNFDKHKVLHANAGLVYQGIGIPRKQRGELWFKDFSTMGDQAEVSIIFGGPDAEPDVKGGQPFQILFADAPHGKVVCTRLDLAVLLDEVRGIITEIGDGAVPAA